MASFLKVDSVSDRLGTGEVDFPNGLTPPTGTFTPVLTDGTNTLNGTGTYIEIGGFVYLEIKFPGTNFTGWGTATGLTVTGAPFTAVYSGSYGASTVIANAARVTSTGTGVFTAYIANSSTTFVLQEQVSGAIPVIMKQSTHLNVASTTIIEFFPIYRKA